jgi:hypothetical protein
VLAVLDLDAELAAIAAPTAVLVGTHDKLTPKVHAHAMAAALPDSLGVTELPGLGHMTPIEDPDAVARAIRTLVAGHLRADGATNADAVVGDVGEAGDVAGVVREAGVVRDAGDGSDISNARDAGRADDVEKEKSA